MSAGSDTDEPTGTLYVLVQFVLRTLTEYGALKVEPLIGWRRTPGSNAPPGRMLGGRARLALKYNHLLLLSILLACDLIDTHARTTISR